MIMNGKIAVLEGDRCINIVKHDVPEPNEDAMILAMGLCGICGTDVHFYTHATKSLVGPLLPVVLGHEICGRIERMGSKAKESMQCDQPLKQGDRVVLYGAVPCGHCWWDRKFGTGHGLLCTDMRYGYGASGAHVPPYFVGGFAEYLYVYPGIGLWRIPDDVSYEEAVLAEPMSIAIRAVEKATSFPGWKNEQTISFGGTVVVLGSGGIGILTCIALKLIGAGKVILVGGAKASLDLAKELGAADWTIDIAKGTSEARIEEVLALTEMGYGADAVFEAAGVPVAFKDALAMVRPTGIVVELGCLIDVGETIEINIPAQITMKDITIFSVHSQPAQDLEKALKTILMSKDRFAYGRLVTRSYPLEQAAEAMEWASSPEKVGKIALRGAGYPGPRP